MIFLYSFGYLILFGFAQDNGQMVSMKSKEKNPHTEYDEGTLKVLPAQWVTGAPTFSTIHMPSETLHNEMPALFIPKG